MSTALTFEYILRHDSKPAHCFSARVLTPYCETDLKRAQAMADVLGLPTLVTTYERALARQRASEIEGIRYASGYAEPGYQDTEKGILFANWNCFSRKVSDVLEAAGYDVEWSDEWATCGDCGKAVRTSADGYDWQPYYIVTEGELVCLDCTDWTSYLESIEDDPNMACVSRCNPGEFGYELLSDSKEYENGFHTGQNDNPHKILKALQATGKEHIVFRIAETSQFYITFETWIRKAENDDL